MTPTRMGNSSRVKWNPRWKRGLPVALKMVWIWPSRTGVAPDCMDAKVPNTVWFSVHPGREIQQSRIQHPELVSNQIKFSIMMLAYCLHASCNVSPLCHCLPVTAINITTLSGKHLIFEFEESLIWSEHWMASNLSSERSCVNKCQHEAADLPTLDANSLDVQTDQRFWRWFWKQTTDPYAHASATQVMLYDPFHEWISEVWFWSDSDRKWWCSVQELYHYITCISFKFPNVQFEAGSLVAQSEAFVLGKSIATFVIPKVDPQGPLPGCVLGQGENFAKTKPMILWEN